MTENVETITISDNEYREMMALKEMLDLEAGRVLSMDEFNEVIAAGNCCDAA